MNDTYKHKGLRRQLVEQLRQKGIPQNAVLKAIDQVPRHLFMDSAFLEHAYQDKAFSIGEGQTISQPYTVAIQTQLLELNSGEKVLEIGTGSGYQASILAAMGADLTTVERNKVLFYRAKRMFKALNVTCQQILGDGTEGYAPLAPYHKIIVTAGAPRVSQALLEQLAIGGYLVIPVGNIKKQTMLRIKKISDTEIVKEEHGTFSFVKLIGTQGWKSA